MLFNSIEFLIFLPTVFLLYWFVFQRNLKLQNLFLVVVSYIFYGWWDVRFLFLIAFTSFCSWGSGLLIGRYADRGALKAKKTILVLNLLINFGILGFFKYFNFFIASFVDAFAAFGITLHPLSLHIILPVGVSFYTFQAMGYSIDVYRGTIKPTRDVVAFFAFVSFFPQLVAGPIERATNLLPQFFHPRRFDYASAVDGLRQMLWGFFKKVVIADNCAIYVNFVFDNPQSHAGSTLLLGAVLFAFQIYGDFSGYSDIAIGAGRLFGINLMRNFAYPYFSRDIAEFWRRWHISLSTWFRDYVYIPLGGSRGTKWQSVRNTLIVFTVSGLWHGANWTFLFWGLFHGLLFLPLLLLKRNRKYTDVVAQGRRLPSLYELCSMMMTFLLVLVGWIIFRSPDMGSAVQYITSIFTHHILAPPSFMEHRRVLVALAINLPVLLCMEWIHRGRMHGLDVANWRNRTGRWSIYCIIVFMIGMYMSTDETPFIYFQF